MVEMLLTSSLFHNVEIAKTLNQYFTSYSRTLHLLHPAQISPCLTLRSMRIAIVTEAFLPQVNGVTNSVLRLLEYCKEEGHDVLIIAPESQGAPNQYLGYKIKHVPSISMKKLIPMGVPKKYLEPLLEGFAPDVIHLASPIFLGHYVARIARKSGIPTVSVYQTDIAGFARHYGLTIAHSTLKRWVSRIHQATDITLAPSKWACRDLEQSGVTNVRLWKRGVDTVNFNPSNRDEELRNSLRDGSDKLIVGYVGRLANEKRIDDLKILDQQDGIQLVIVGDGPAGARLCQGIQEALAAGVPVIGPDTGGPVDLIEHGITGLLIDTSLPHELLVAVETLRSHNSLDLMQLAARRSVEHRTWNYINSQLMNHYRDAIAQISKKREMVA